jgi:hypothetical protein
MDIDRKRTIKSMLINVARIADKDYQRRVWIEASSLTECDSFDDAVCDFFQGSEDLIAKYKDFEITDNQIQLLTDFWNAFDTFVSSTERPYLEKDFIDTSEWTQIVDMAQKLLKAFGYKAVNGDAIPESNDQMG